MLCHSILSSSCHLLVFYYHVFDHDLGLECALKWAIIYLSPRLASPMTTRLCSWSAAMAVAVHPNTTLALSQMWIKRQRIDQLFIVAIIAIIIILQLIHHGPGLATLHDRIYLRKIVILRSIHTSEQRLMTTTLIIGLKRLNLFTIIYSLLFSIY